MLLAHVLGVERSRLALVDDVPPAVAERYDALVARRAGREPLQHLTGVAHFRHVDLLVGPGVFVPRPETEVLAGWAIDAARSLASSGSTDDRWSSTSAPARERSPGPSPTRSRPPGSMPSSSTSPRTAGPPATWPAPGSTCARATSADAFDDLAGAVDVVVSNPPYIPHEAWESVAVEVRDHDPQLALYATGDGLDTIRVVERRAATLLRPGEWSASSTRTPRGRGAGRVQRHRSLGAGARPRRPGRAPAVRDRAAGTMTPSKEGR